VLIIGDAFIHPKPLRYPENHHKFFTVPTDKKACWNRVDLQLKALGTQYTMKRRTTSAQMCPTENPDSFHYIVPCRIKEACVTVMHKWRLRLKVSKAYNLAGSKISDLHWPQEIVNVVKSKKAFATKEVIKSLTAE
jgi:hypothetical protein